MVNILCKYKGPHKNCLFGISILVFSDPGGSVDIFLFTLEVYLIKTWFKKKKKNLHKQWKLNAINSISKT